MEEMEEIFKPNLREKEDEKTAELRRKLHMWPRRKLKEPKSLRREKPQALPPRKGYTRDRIVGVMNTNHEIKLENSTHCMTKRHNTSVRQIDDEIAELDFLYRKMQLDLKSNSLERSRRSHPELNFEFEERLLKNKQKYFSFNPKGYPYLQKQNPIPCRTAGLLTNISPTVREARKLLAQRYRHARENAKPKPITERRKGIMPATDETADLLMVRTLTKRPSRVENSYISPKLLKYYFNRRRDSKMTGFLELEFKHLNDWTDNVEPEMIQSLRWDEEEKAFLPFLS